MLKKCLAWIRSHPKTVMFLVTVAALAFLDLGAYRQAYVMTHFAAGGDRTAPPESLNLLQKASALLVGVRVPRPINACTPDSFGLAFEVHRFAATPTRELEAWYCESPQPKGLVLLFHGYAAAKSSLLNEARVFHRLGFAAFLVDFQGSGGSDGNETTIGVRESEDVVQACAYAARHWPRLPLILYGQSMGSAAILRAVAVHGLTPAALVLECPFDRLLSSVENRFSIMGLPSFPLARLLVFWGGLQHGFNGFRHNPVEYASIVRSPVLLLQGRLDTRTTLAQAESIYGALAEPKAMHVFADLGHESYVQARPEEWRASVSEFLTSVGSR